MWAHLMDHCQSMCAFPAISPQGLCQQRGLHVCLAQQALRFLSGTICEHTAHASRKAICSLL